MAEKTITYKNESITVFWKPEICMHAAKCVGGSPAVFNPKKKPWVNVNAESVEKIMATIDRCPSKALSYANPGENNKKNKISSVEFSLMKNGPILVNGPFCVKDTDGNIIKEGEKAALCRCGGSANKPFCDGTHKSIGFEG
jgi:uncharacterized Fe-S cluster protein YjdI